MYHLLKLRAVIGLCRHRSVDICINDGVTLAVCEGFAFPQLTLYTLFSLMVARVSCVNNCLHLLPPFCHVVYTHLCPVT